MNIIVNDIVSSEFRTIGIIDTAVSTIWIERFNDVGEFEIYLRATPEIFTMFSTEKYLTRADSDIVMISEKITLTTDPENGNYITISGRSAESLMYRRVADRMYNYTDIAAETLMRTLVRTSMIDQTTTDRRIPIVSLGTSHGYPEQIPRIQIFGENILDVVTDIAKGANLGYKMRLNRETNRLVFDVLKGTDRSYAQHSQRCVCFSPEFDNLGNTTYNNDRTNTHNFVYAAGEGNGGAKPVVTLPTSNIPTGINRREMWLDASGVSATTADGTLTPEQYQAALGEAGQQALNENKAVKEFSGEALYHSQYKYNVDYFLGDKVQVQNGYGVNATAYITEMTIVDDESGYSMHPTLSNWETA